MRYGDSDKRKGLHGGKLPQQSVVSEDGMSSRYVEEAKEVEEVTKEAAYNRPTAYYTLWGQKLETPVKAGTPVFTQDCKQIAIHPLDLEGGVSKVEALSTEEILQRAHDEEAWE